MLSKKTNLASIIFQFLGVHSPSRQFLQYKIKTVVFPCSKFEGTRTLVQLKSKSKPIGYLIHRQPSSNSPIRIHEFNPNLHSWGNQVNQPPWKMNNNSETTPCRKTISPVYIPGCSVEQRMNSRKAKQHKVQKPPERCHRGMIFYNLNQLPKFPGTRFAGKRLDEKVNPFLQ